MTTPADVCECGHPRGQHGGSNEAGRCDHGCCSHECDGSVARERAARIAAEARIAGGVLVPRLDFERLMDALSKTLAHEQRLCASDLIGTGHSHKLLRLLQAAMLPFNEALMPKVKP